MTEEQNAQEVPPQGEMPSAEPAGPAAPRMDVKEIQEGKAFAVLSYALSLVGLPFFIVPLVMRNNAFALYHAKQCLMLWLGGIATGVVAAALSVICIGLVLGPILGIALVVLAIMGLINAAKEEVKPLPIIGKWGEDWFKGLQKAS